MKILSHKFDPKEAAEIVILEDAHGRKHHIHIPILRERCPHCGTPFQGGVSDPDEILREMLAIHEDQEAVIAQHIAERFDPKTLERIRK